MQLELVKKEVFGEVELDIYSKSGSDEMFMTAKQLGEALEYSTGAQAIINIVNRNPELQGEEFSVQLSLSSTDGKSYNTRVFTEDGIYEITMLSKQPKAREFRMFIRNLLKGLRSGKLKIVTEQPKASFLIEDNIERAKAWLKEEEQRLELTYQVEDMKPKAEYTEEVLDNSQQLYNASNLAKEYGLSAVTFNKVLNEMGIQYKNNKIWTLYARFQNKGYKKNKTVRTYGGNFVTESYFTEEGRKFVYDALKEHYIFHENEDELKLTKQRVKALLKNGYESYYQQLVEQLPNHKVRKLGKK